MKSDVSQELSSLAAATQKGNSATGTSDNLAPATALPVAAAALGGGVLAIIGLL